MSFAVNPLLEPEDRKAKPEPFPGQLIVAPALGRFWRLFRISVWRAFEHDAFATAKASAYSSILTFFPSLVAFGSRIETRVLFHIDHELGPLVLLLWVAIRWTIAILTSIAVIALIYHNAVPRTQPWHSVIPGAVLATGLWLSATAFFGWYL